MKKWIFVLIFRSLTLGTARPQDALTDSINSRTKGSLSENVPDVAIRVSGNGVILYKKAFDLANI